MTTQELIQNFLQLQEAYQFTRRKLVTGDRYKEIVLTGLVEKGDYEQEIIREPLMEHVGHLPILASYFHPHIKHNKEVNLGRALVMLSIHDIGETVTGEIFAYHKTDQHAVDEYEAAIKVLDSQYHEWLDEYEANETWDAKYARSIDVLAPNIHEVNMPKVTLDRFAALGATTEDVRRKKQKYMQWDSVMLEVFNLLLEQYDRVSSGEEPLFTPVAHDIL